MTHGHMSGEEITQAQIDQLMAMTGGAARKVLQLMIKHGEIDHEGIQRVLSTNSTLYKQAMREAIKAALQRLCNNQRFIYEEVVTHRNYPLNHRPLSIVEQIEILCQYWPMLNADAAIRYARQVWPSLETPDWVEGPFALIRPGFFSEVYTDEITEVFRVLSETAYCRFNDQLKGRRGQEHLRQSQHDAHALQVIARQQNSDILIVGAQFGLRHRGRSARRALAVMDRCEFGIGVKDAATMLLTHPSRLNGPDYLWLECPGDEYSFGANTTFDDSCGFADSYEHVRFLITSSQEYRASAPVTAFLPPS